VREKCAITGCATKTAALKAEVQALLKQTMDEVHNDTSLVDLAMRVNQIDRRVSRGEGASVQGQIQASAPSEARANLVSRPAKAVNSSSQGGATPSTLKRGMTQQEVMRLFGEPHAVEQVLGGVYWYYAAGELKGQYVRFDASTGHVNGWSRVAPQLLQLNFRVTPGPQDR
jgi:SmpA / OmlA family